MDTGITLNPERRDAMLESGAWNDKLITDYLDQAVASTPDREAIVGYQVTSDTRTALTYRQLNDKVTRMATWWPASYRTGGRPPPCIWPACASARF